MSIIVKNNFQTNNYISISKHIRKIPFFSSYFIPVKKYINLDEKYTENTSDNINDIQHKILCFDDNNHSTCILEHNFVTSVYHVFLSCSILHKNNISYTVTSHESFVSLENSSPLLYDYTTSFYFPNIKYNNLRSYFSLALLDNPYIPIDIFVITYLVHNNIPLINNIVLDTIVKLYTSNREKIDRNIILLDLTYLLKYSTAQIVKYLLQFKYTWSYYQLTRYFILNYHDELNENKLYDICQKYINSLMKNRDSNIVKHIHNIIFTTL